MNYRCSTPVLLIFFNRADTFEKVFARVREAKPRTLILAQDGPRGEKDLKGIEECRKIAESVDWDCEIIRDYSETNLGCGMRPQTAITNALNRFEQVIILEDDCVPSLSFFRYCDELLEKYKDDERICYISGLNHFEEWDCGGKDYFYTKTGAIWGWATWRRAWNKYDYYVKSIEDEYSLNLVKSQFLSKSVAEQRVVSWRKAYNSLENGEKLSYWDAQWGYVKYSQNMLVIVPAKNLIHNIGVGVTSTHAPTMEAKFVKYRNFVFIPTYDMEFPLRSPDVCVCDEKYDDLVYKCSNKTSLIIKIKKLARKVLRKNR
ncbi:MAG: nucleotide-diphospho-sugar transferase [Clostridia bacterium]|nr:nucleotide-diphospho-sugar transferase [Clostridia bacterium]